MYTIDKLAYASKIATIPAREKILFSMLPLCFSLLSTSYILHSIVFILLSFFTIKYSTLSVSGYGKLLRIPATFIALGLVTVVFNFSITDTTDLFYTFTLYKWPVYISYTGLHLAVNIFTRAVSSISCFYFLILTTPMNNLFSYLQKRKVSPLLITLTELIYRFSFVLFGELERIRTAQLSRLGYLHFKDGIRSAAEILALVFESSMIKVNNIDMMLQSRCFDGDFNVISDAEQYSGILKGKTIGINLCLFVLLCMEVYFKWIY